MKFLLKFKEMLAMPNYLLKNYQKHLVVGKNEKLYVLVPLNFMNLLNLIGQHVLDTNA
jgi:hypothetical protein